MAKTDIGNLVVKISGSAEEFEKEIARAENRLTGFASKISSPLNAMRGLGGGITDMIARPMQGLISDVLRFTALIPGLGGMSAVIAHPIQAATESMERLDKLGKDAKRFGLDPQFLRAFQIHAEDEAGAIGSVMARVLRFQAQLRSGSQDIEEAGGSPAGKVAKELRLDIEAWKAADPAQLVKLLGEVAKRGTGTEFDDLARIAGRGVSGLMNTLKNADGLDIWIKRAEEAKVATKANIALAEQWDDILKKQKLRSEGRAEKTMPIGMAFTEAWEDLKNVSPMQALEAGLFGVGQLIRAASPFGAELYLTPKSANSAIKSAQEAFVSAGASGADLTQINQLNDELNNIINNLGDLDKNPMRSSLAEHIAQMAAKAKDLVPKTPVENLEKAAMKASELKKNLQDVADTSKHMGDVWQQHVAGQLSEGRSWKDSLLNPAEKIAKQMKELERNPELDLQGTDMYYWRRHLKKRLKELEGGSSGPSEANVALYGSQEWAKAFTRQSEKVDDDMKEELATTRHVIEEIRDRLKFFDPPKPLQAPP